MPSCHKGRYRSLLPCLPFPDPPSDRSSSLRSSSLNQLITTTNTIEHHLFFFIYSLFLFWQVSWICSDRTWQALKPQTDMQVHTGRQLGGSWISPSKQKWVRSALCPENVSSVRCLFAEMTAVTRRPKVSRLLTHWAHNCKFLSEYPPWVYYIHFCSNIEGLSL